MSNEIKHVLIIPSSSFQIEEDPMGGIFQYAQANAIISAGYKVGVISAMYLGFGRIFHKLKFKKDEVDNNIVIKRSVTYSYIPQRLLPFWVRCKIVERAFVKLFKEYVRDNGIPDLIHAHNVIYAGFAAKHIKEIYNIPFILTEHSTDYARGIIKNQWAKAITNCLIQASEVTAVSSQFANLLSNRYEFEVSVLPNVVSDIFFCRRSPEKSSIFTFINIATLDHKKNHRLLIKAFSHQFRDKNACLKIVGDGPLADDLYSLVKELGIEDKVTFLGFMHQEDVALQLATSHCFVLTSDFETFGVVLIEALASGLPTISTKSGGPEDIINKSNGILIDVGDQIALQESMNYIYNNLNNYNPVDLSKDVYLRYGVLEFQNRFSNLYNKVVFKLNKNYG